MRFTADHSENLEVFFASNRLYKRPSLRFSVSCLRNGDCAITRALCGMAFWDKISHPEALASSFTRHNTTGFFSCGVMSRAVYSEHQLTDLMTWRPYQECDLGYSSGHAPQNNFSKPRRDLVDTLYFLIVDLRQEIIVNWIGSRCYWLQNAEWIFSADIRLTQRRCHPVVVPKQTAYRLWSVN
jgi:hypothetical protein